MKDNLKGQGECSGNVGPACGDGDTHAGHGGSSSHRAGATVIAALSGGGAHAEARTEFGRTKSTGTFRGF
ncbi:MAG: hypothetical protein H6807_15150 [Planctomycetes bacterium]|nr:hypothetical protein [Planctomycetota bacterium]